MFEEGKKKIEKSFDMIKIVDNIRKLKVMMNYQLSNDAQNKNRIVYRLNSENKIINIDSSNDDNDKNSNVPDYNESPINSSQCKEIEMIVDDPVGEEEETCRSVQRSREDVKKSILDQKIYFTFK